MRRSTSLIVAAALLLCVAAGPATKSTTRPAAPVRTSLKKLLESVPKSERGPQASGWTDAQIDKYKAALESVFVGKAYGMEAGQITKVEHVNGTVSFDAAMDHLTAGGLFASVKYHITLSETGARVADKMRVHEVAYVNGTVQTVTFTDRGWDSERGLEQCDLEIDFVDAVVR